MAFEDLVGAIGKVVDAVGVAVMVVGLAYAGWRYLRRHDPARSGDERYRMLRSQLGRAVLVGLELLVAGDIIRSVAISPTFASVGVLAIIVAVRSFLSTTLEMEISGRWPWQRAD